MEKASSSSAPANATKLTLGQSTDMPVPSFQLFGATIETAAASSAAASDISAAATAASQNATIADATQGQDSLSLSLQPAALSAPTMGPPASRSNIAVERAAALRGHLRRCVEALATARSADADAELASVMRLASADGDAAQRMAVAFAEALARVAIRPWRGVSAALFATHDADNDGSPAVASEARHNFLAVCPLLRLAAVAVNELILDATRHDKLIHIVDIGGVNHSQWMELIAFLGSRWQGRPTSLRLTVVIKEPKEFYSQAATMLTDEATRHRLPSFELDVVESSLEALKMDDLGVRTDHAVVIVSTLQLHRLVGTRSIASSSSSSVPVSASSLADDLLRGFHRVSPRIIIITENEARHFGPGFRERFVLALDYYEQLFCSMEEASLFCQPAERKAVERHFLKEEIKDIIACEDGPQWARHEPLDRWIARMGAVGFVFWPMSIVLAAGRVRSVAAKLPSGGHGYRVTEGDGWLILNRMNKPMFSVSVWTKK
uniref:Uncharacterized protein n=1 Tax=Leersia perrieri TaxID=77586 RepID=A0A0D9WFX2_9ORYZ